MRALSVLWLLLLPGIGVACRADPVPAPAPQNTARAPGPVLPPVSLPNLDRVAPAVQAQIRARYDAVSRGASDTSATNVDRARRVAELGHVLLAATFFDEAVLCYRHAEALEPASPTWPYLRAHAALRRGDREASAEAFEHALSLSPDYLPAMIWLGDVYLDLERTDDAKAMFARALKQQPESAAALFGAGRVALEQRAYPAAIDLMEHALRADARASAIRYPLAMAYRASGQSGKAAVLLQQRGSSPPDLQDPMLQEASVLLGSAVSYEGVGMEALRRQDWAGAVEAFRRGLEVAPSDPSLRYWMASAMIAGGDVPGAIREFQAVVRTHPDYAKAHFSLGAIFEQQGKRAEALQEYDAAVRYAPNLPDARLRLARALAQNGQRRPAFTQFDEAVRLDPHLVDAWLGGAQVLLAMGDTSAAREWISRGRRLHPGRPEWSQLEAQAR